MQTGAFKSLQEGTQDGLEAMKVPVALFQAPQSETVRVLFGGCLLVETIWPWDWISAFRLGHATRRGGVRLVLEQHYRFVLPEQQRSLCVKSCIGIQHAGHAWRLSISGNGSAPSSKLRT